jgi:hypothetical protein
MRIYQDYIAVGIKKHPILCAAAVLITLAGCGGPFGKWELQRNPVAEVNTGTGRHYETVTRNGLEFQIERSGAHPAITGPVGPNRLQALLSEAADTVSYGDIFMLQGNRYIFIKECDGVLKWDNKYTGTQERAATFRILEYADKEALYIFRDVDMDGRKFKTFIVVASWQKPSGSYFHSIEQRTNERSEIKYCK